MPQAGFEPTEVGVTGFQLNAKQTLYLQATTAGYYNHKFKYDFYSKWYAYFHVTLHLVSGI